MEPKRHLTGFLEDPISQPEIAALLDEAGLELWQAPEGFWAIRAKPPAPAMAPKQRRAPGRSR